MTTASGDADTGRMHGCALAHLTSRTWVDPACPSRFHNLDVRRKEHDKENDQCVMHLQTTDVVGTGRGIEDEEKNVR